MAAYGAASNDDAPSDKKKPTADEELADIKTLFKEHQDAWQENRDNAKEDLEFGPLGQQWPDYAIKSRGENRPRLTINRMNAFSAQVTNDCRQNRPSIKVRPVDNGADVRTARVYDGLIRSIEQISSADVAYDTAVWGGVNMGFGFWRIAIEYSHDDSFDKDLLIKRIGNPLSVWPDPYSTEADSSDWNTAFICETMKKTAFEKQYKGAESVDWDAANLESPWIEGEDITLAEYWCREEVEREIHKLSTGAVVDDAVMKEHRDAFAAMGVTVDASRMSRGYKVVQKLMTGAEVLETNDWAGKYIPIIAVYGNEVNEEGKRHFFSLIRDAKDPQRMFNFWRTTATELVALSPKAPWLINEESMPDDVNEAKKWKSANIENHAALMWKGQIAPSRIPFAGPAGGALQEALNAADDMKSTLGMYDASLGARSNETSGVAIERRKMEGDTATFHFTDNLSRAICHCGRVLIDLIPKVYSGERMVRVLGQDGTAQTVKVGKPPEAQGMPPQIGQQQAPAAPGQPPQSAGPTDATGQPMTPPTESDPLEGVFDLSAGKYDLTVTVGPSYSTKRVEAAEQMMQLLQAFPAAAPIIGDLVAKNLDWPGADEIAARLKQMLPPQLQGEDPRAQQAQQQMQEMAQQMQAMMDEMKQLKLQAANAAGKLMIDRRKNVIEAYKAETDRMTAVREIMVPPVPPEEQQAAE